MQKKNVLPFGRRQFIIAVKFALLLFFLSELPANGKTLFQQHIIHGHITDSSGNGLKGVTVFVKGTKRGAVTNTTGDYKIQANQGETLEFSFVGYQSQTVTVGQNDEIDIQLVTVPAALNDVVVIGYGTQKKADLAGAISSTTGKAVTASPVSNVLEGLQGRVAGVSVALNSGAPGSLPTVLIRGIGSLSSGTDPLYVVDGVATNNIQYLNPYDIQSVDVLKDASAAAIYGSRGSNGVIMITTKRGAASKGVVVSYTTDVSRGTLAKEMKVLNSTQWVGMIKQAMANNPLFGVPEQTLNTSDSRLFNAQGEPIYNTDWQKAVTRTAISNDHQLSIQQRGDNSSTGVFFNYSNNEGIMLHSGLRRYNIKLAHDLTINKWLDFGVNILYNYSVDNIVPPTTGANTPTRTMIEMPSIFPVKYQGQWANNQFDPDLSFLDPAENPVKVLEEQTNQNKTGEVFGNAFLNFKINKYLQFKTQFGLDNQNIRTEYYSPSDLLNISANQKGVASIGSAVQTYWQQENYLTYDRNFGLHHLNVVLGASWQQQIYESLGGSSQYFPDDYSQQYNLGSGSQPSPPSSGYSKWSINSYFARAQYDFSAKYLMTLTERIDGSSRFGSANKYASFPSIGVGYVISREPFMKHIKAINFLKIRASYGATGNTEISPYQSLATIGNGTTLLNGGYVSTAWVNNIANPNLKWEESKETDIGLEARLFDDRISFEGDYYYKLTNNLLLDNPIPATTGFGSVLTNIGSMSNKGVDLTLTTTNIRSKNFTWVTNFVANYNKNKVLHLGTSNADIFPGPFWGPVSQGFTILRVGQPAGSFWGYQRLGIYSQQEVTDSLASNPSFPYIAGQEKESNNKKILGHEQPDWTGSFVNTFTYKHFSLMIDLQFSQGASVAQAFLFSSEDRQGYSNSLATVLNAWTPDHQNTDIQQLRFAPAAGQLSSFDSHWVANGSFIRGRNILLSYDFAPSVFEKIKLKSLRVYVSGQNVFLIHAKSFQGWDPQGVSFNYGNSGATAFQQNIDFYEYPKARTFTVGANLSF